MWSVLASVVVAVAPLDLSSLAGPERLPALVWAQSPDLAPARVRLAAALAERDRATRLPNPGLDVGLNTLPVGPTNPPGLADPLLNVPNLSVGLSLLLEVGKRGPRQEATAAAARSAAFEVLEVVRQRAIDLDDAIGDVAAAQLRVEALVALGDDAERLSALQQARAEKGDTAPLDADRARLELEATRTAVAEARAELASALQRCAEVVATPCVPFDGAAGAGAWLAHRQALDGPVGERPDLQALDATARAARSSELLARRRAWPDPTVRVGYLRDQFVVSGNQQNSLFVGVSLPLPLFDRGQDDAAAAAVEAGVSEESRQRLLDSAGPRLERLRADLEAVEARRERLRGESLPLARSVVERLDAAVARGAAPLPELLLARRTLAELLLTAAGLDRAAHHLHLERARLAAGAPLLPGVTP